LALVDSENLTSRHPTSFVVGLSPVETGFRLGFDGIGFDVIGFRLEFDKLGFDVIGFRQEFDKFGFDELNGVDRIVGLLRFRCRGAQSGMCEAKAANKFNET
jgi:hypothetical protein